MTSALAGHSSETSPTLELVAPPEPQLVERLTLIADPMPAPRPRGRIAGPKSAPWVQVYMPTAATKRAEAFGLLWQTSGTPQIPAGQLVELRAVFCFMRPGFHFGTGRNAAVLKPQYRAARPGKGGGVTKAPDGSEHATGGDVDNLLKLVADGLSGEAFEDDGAVARMIGEKLYTDQAGVGEPCTIVEVWTL